MRLSCYVRACAKPQGTLTVKPTKSQPWSDLFIMTSTTVLRSTLITKQKMAFICAYCQRTVTPQLQQSVDSVTYTQAAAQSAGRQQQAVPR